MAWWVPISVAVIGGPVMWFLARFDRRNTEQHSSNMHVLNRIESKVDKIDERVDNHIHWHLHGHRDD
jgi:hypothetical protein